MIVEYGVLLVILTESECVLWEEGGGYSSVISCQHESLTGHYYTVKELQVITGTSSPLSLIW
jgi:hypothetical protein